MTDKVLGPYTRRATCRVCGSMDVASVLDFGGMPLAGNFVLPEDAASVRHYPLDLCVCRSCTLMQVLNVVDARILFTDYRYLSSITHTLMQHFRDYAATLRDRGLAGADKLVVEIGCNDGVLLGPLKALGVKAIGVDAADNVVAIARAKGLDVIAGFFGGALAERIRADHGPAHVITASNVFAHIDDLDEIMRGVVHLLHDDGSFIVEVHYGVDLIASLQFDTVYHEHLCYYTVGSLDVLFGRYGLEIYDVERLPMHGGAIRVFGRRPGSGTSESPARHLELRALEERMGLRHFEAYEVFADNVRQRVAAIRDLIVGRKRAGRRISAFGAAGRATIMLNYCGLDHSVIDYIVDESPSRCGRIVPGTGIPIVPLQQLIDAPTDDCLVTAWNYRDEILAKAAPFRRGGGQMIFPLPQLDVL